MKIDKSSPRHWLWLSLFTLNVLLVWLARLLFPGGPRDAVVLYGHKFNGNLRALHEQARVQPGSPALYFLTMDPVYGRQLRDEGLPVLVGTCLADMRVLRRARALVSDHGLHTLSWWLGRSDLTFVDVWHGIPFKGFDADDFRVQHRYDEVWVASPLLRDLYVGRFGFPPSIVQATGYARTDRLVRDVPSAASARERLGLPADRRMILFAPTWQQDDRDRAIYPFGMDEADFLARMGAFCAENDAVCVVRRHLNTREAEGARHPHVLFRPYEQYPDAEGELLAADVLVCDWSSIAFDFLLLDRPTLFLDVPAPFAKGFSLDANWRFGEIIPDAAAMFSALQVPLQEPARYWQQQGETHRRVRAALYGDCADGRAAERCLQRLGKL